MLKADTWIRKQALENDMIVPFTDGLVRYSKEEEKIISYGLSSYGYDVRLADEYQVFTNVKSTIINPKAFDQNALQEIKDQGYCIIPPNSFALGRSLEYIKMPRNVTGIVLGKSTYARCGIVANFTPLESEWEGHITIEISNTAPLPAIVYSYEGFAQILFLESDESCEVSYADRGGKYQNQTSITLAQV